MGTGTIDGHKVYSFIISGLSSEKEQKNYELLINKCLQGGIFPVSFPLCFELLSIR